MLRKSQRVHTWLKSVMIIVSAVFFSLSFLNYSFYVQINVPVYPKANDRPLSLPVDITHIFLWSILLPQEWVCAKCICLLGLCDWLICPCSSLAPLPVTWPLPLPQWQLPHSHSVCSICFNSKRQHTRCQSKDIHLLIQMKCFDSAEGILNLSWVE